MSEAVRSTPQTATRVDVRVFLCSRDKRRQSYRDSEVNVILRCELELFL